MKKREIQLSDSSQHKEPPIKQKNHNTVYFFIGSILLTIILAYIFQNFEFSKVPNVQIPNIKEESKSPSTNSQTQKQEMKIEISKNDSLKYSWSLENLDIESVERVDWAPHLPFTNEVTETKLIYTKSLFTVIEISY